MRAYYNEIDRYCCDWLQNLMDAGLITPGRIDDRDIREVQPDDVRGYERCHFFAGIAGWDIALNLAGWGMRPVWTGSCPCQDFSLIGKRMGFEGDRDLWPSWFGHISELKPDWIFGEQVAHAAWLDRTAADLEKMGYAVGAIVLPALAIGAQHERSRLYFAANSDAARWENIEGFSPAETQSHIGRPAGMVSSEASWDFRWPLVPDKDWIVDGLRGGGHAVSALGNAIVPQVAAEFIKAASGA